MCICIMYLHCEVCSFIKVYEYDFEVMKYVGYVMPWELYQIYNHWARVPQAWWRGDYKPDIAQVTCMFIQLNEATNLAMHISNHGAHNIYSTVWGFEG